MLKVVKAQNPDMPYKQQQQKAKEMLAEFKAAQAAHASNDVDFTKKPDIPGQEADGKALAKGTERQADKKGQPDIKPVSKRVTITDLAAAEKIIRDSGGGRGHIQTVGRSVIPEGELVVHGKDGVNSLVTWEDKNGNKLPVYGFFKIWI